MKKKVLYYILTLVLLFSLLSGCSVNNKKEDTKQNPVQKENEQMQDAQKEGQKDAKADEKIEDRSNNKPLSEKADFYASEIDREDYQNPDPNFVKSKGFLYKMKNPANESIVYLLGSIHIYREDYYPLSDAIMNAYKESKSLSYEILDAANPSAEDIAYMMEKITYKGNDALKNHISPELYEKLKQVQKKFNFPPNLVTMYTPIFAATNLEVYLGTLKGHNPFAGIEGFFMRKAKRDQKPEYEIENFKFQIDMLSGMSEETQIQMLEEIVDKMLEMDLEAQDDDEDLFTHWYTGNEEQILIDLKDSEMTKNTEYMDKMIYDRNKVMADYVDNMLQTKSNETNMVLVGALHVIGEGGIVDLLKDKGYEIDRQ